VHDFRQEMDSIGKAVSTCPNKYKDIATRPNFPIPFSKDLKTIGQMLAGRIRHEENMLYRL
jgi:hypothetical protein